MTHAAYFVALWLFLVGMYGLCTTRNYIHAAGCLSVMQSATYVLLLAVGYREHAHAPVYSGTPQSPAVDSVVQSLALTDIVVGAAVTALILALAVQAAKRRGTLDPRELRPLQG